jgi:hypothetical protein
MRNPQALIISVSAEFDISPDEAIKILESIHGKMKKDEENG